LSHDSPNFPKENLQVSACGGYAAVDRKANRRTLNLLIATRKRRFAAVNLRRLRRFSETRRKQGCGGCAAVGVRTPPYPPSAYGARLRRRAAAQGSAATDGSPDALPLTGLLLGGQKLALRVAAWPAVERRANLPDGIWRAGGSWALFARREDQPFVPRVSRLR
jgi:hypothetical protein